MNKILSRNHHHGSLRKQIRSTYIAVCGKSTVSRTETKGVLYKTLQDESRDKTKVVLPKHADVVVLGGGSIGCSTLYHLTKMGVKNSVLIEKEQLTAGTTWHTAGMAFTSRNTETETRLAAMTRELVDTIEEETGVNTGFLINGGLTLASSEPWLCELKQLHTFSKTMGLETHLLTPSDIRNLYPIMNTEDVLGGLYNADDGSLDPAGYCEGLTRAAKLRGAQIFTGTAMTDIETYVDESGRRKVKAVHTDKGRIETDAVVVCGGCWTPYMLEPLGISIPQYQLKHTYVVTEGIEGVTGMPNVRDPNQNFYLRTQGDAVQIGSFEYGVPFIDDGQVARDFAFGLYEMDWDTFAQPVENACNRVPAIGEAGIKSTVCGPESFTPDGHGLLGPNPDISGLYHAHTMNSIGMSYSGGVGDMMAQWIVNGEPNMSMYAFDIRRWNPKILGNKQWIKEMTHETFSNFFSNHWPFDEPLAGRTHSIKDPLYQTLLEDGCLFEYRGGWERSGYFNHGQKTPTLPYDYSGEYGSTRHEDYPYREILTRDYTFDFPKHHHMIGEECMNARNKANLFNMTYFGKLYLSGPDATKAADWIFSNNMDKEPGTTTYTCMLNKLGGIESDLTVSVVDDDGPERQLGITDPSYYVAAGGRFAPYVKSRILQAISELKFDCKLSDITYDVVILSLQGPLSREILACVSPMTDLSNEQFPFSTHQVIDVAGHHVRALRISFVGEMGWELHVPNTAALDVYHALHRAGKALGLKNSGYRAMDSLSMEKGYRMWTSDIRSDDSPLEADLAFTCKLKTDKPFLGREALERYKAEGITKRLVCFTLPKPAAAALHGREVIYRDGVLVGYIRRAEYAFSLDTVIAWGYITNPSGGKINKDYIMSGKYQLERMNELLDVSVHMKSPFDPKHRRIQGFYEKDCIIQQEKRLQAADNSQ